MSINEEEISVLIEESNKIIEESLQITGSIVIRSLNDYSFKNKHEMISTNSMKLIEVLKKLNNQITNGLSNQLDHKNEEVFNLLIEATEKILTQMYMIKETKPILQYFSCMNSLAKSNEDKINFWKFMNLSQQIEEMLKHIESKGYLEFESEYQNQSYTIILKLSKDEPKTSEIEEKSKSVTKERNECIKEIYEKDKQIDDLKKELEELKTKNKCLEEAFEETQMGKKFKKLENELNDSKLFQGMWKREYEKKENEIEDLKKQHKQEEITQQQIIEDLIQSGDMMKIERDSLLLENKELNEEKENILMISQIQIYDAFERFEEYTSKVRFDEKKQKEEYEKEIQKLKEENTKLNEKVEELIENKKSKEKI